MKKAFYLAAAAAASLVAGGAQAAVITGGFSIASFGGTYMVGASPTGTAQTATGLDLGLVFGSSGNGYGVNGSALVGNATGSFASYNGSTVSVSDISLGATANPFPNNPFIVFGTGAGQINLNFSNATISRTSTSVTVAGNATFTNGGDTTGGMFSLSADSRSGNPSAINFTYTANASAVPEPATWGMMIVGFGLLGGVVRRRKTTVAFA